MRNIIIAVFIIAIGLYGWSNGEENDITDNIQLEEEIINLQAAESAWRNNDAEFREMRKQCDASQTEIREFAEFIAELKRKVIEGCEIVRRLEGDASKYGIDCVEILDESKIDDSISSFDAADLSAPVGKSILYEEELRKLEGDFDDILMKAQNELQKKKKVDIASGGPEENNKISAQGGKAEKGRQSTESKGKTEKAKQDVESEDIAGMTEQGVRPGGVDKTSKQDTGAGGRRDEDDSRDDDVIARQLKEAAENETDPVLKEQLWKEYEKYKKPR